MEACLHGRPRAECRAATGDYDEARQVLVEAVSKLPPGLEARRAVCDLAEVCLSAGRYEQALSVAGQVAGADEPDIRNRANTVLAEAHLARKEYQ